MEKDFFYTIRRNSTAETKVKGSRFIGHVFGADSRDEAESCIAAVRKEHHSATHNCFAYRTGTGDSSVFRFSDDGEPSGTAGKPILDAIDSRELTDVAVIVTRYYGGTKLGTGGLIRAYGGCASEALKEAQLKKRFIFRQITVIFPYELTGAVMGAVAQAECRVHDTQYGTDTEMIIHVRVSQADMFVTRITDACAGKAEITCGKVLSH